MAKLHLMCGFMGFGKSTIAKQLQKKFNAVCLSPDEFMLDLYGRKLSESNFRIAKKRVDVVIWKIAEQVLKSGVDVILDYGYWTKVSRREAYERGIKIADEVIMEQVICSMETAKKRLLKRGKDDENELDINSSCFEMFVGYYEPIETEEGYTVVKHNNE